MDESTACWLSCNFAAKDVTTDQTKSIKPCTTAENSNRVKNIREEKQAHTNDHIPSENTQDLYIHHNQHYVTEQGYSEYIS